MKREYVILAVILAIAFVLRIYGVLTDVFPFFREATYGMAAWRIIDGDMPYSDFYHSQPPLSPFLLAFVFLIFGVGVVQARLFLVFFTTFTSFVIFLAGKRIDYKTGLLGSLVFATTPWCIVYGMRAVNDHIAMTFCIIGYFFLTPVFAIQNRDKKMDTNAERNNLILAGLFVSIGVMIKTIVAPILIAFIVILFVETLYTGAGINNQVKNIVFLFLGFIVPLLIVYSPFYLLIGDQFTIQVLGQHFEKPPTTWIGRLEEVTSLLVLDNFYFFVFFILSVFFAIRRPYGRGLVICILVMVLSIFFFVPRAHPNYYYALLLWMAMVCGFFPFPDFKSLSLKIEILILNFIIILNLLSYKIYRYSNLDISKASYFNHFSATIALFVTSIALIVLIIFIIKERQLSEFKIKAHVKNLFSSPYQIWKRLRSLVIKDEVRIVIAILFIALIATTYVSYFPISESDKKSMDWIKANASPDEYVLADSLKINFWTLRRSPFAEISKDRTFIGELTGEMFIDACYEYDIRYVVDTGRLFGELDTYDVFLEFLAENYVPILEGHTIYVRTTSLK
jgi:4-amino-4-deoxy-L-arabinose transferase-like glycosyltransferase